MKRLIKKFKDIDQGQTCETYVMLESITQKTAKNGSCYVELALCDGESCVVARKFETEASSLRDMGIIEPCVARVCLNVSIYNGSRSYIVYHIALGDDVNLKLDDFIMKAPIDPEETFNKLIENIKSSYIDNDLDELFIPIADLAIGILTENKGEFIRAAAAKNIHHNVIGGLLYHSATMAEQAIKVMETYPGLDSEILISGAALHDIGKIKEMQTTTTGKTEYTKEGRLLGHSAIGIMMVEEAANRLGFFDLERVSLLQHMIASHHGLLEYGAIVTPAIPEALVLHALDMIDSKVYVFDEVYKDLDVGALSNNIYALNNTSAYRPYSLTPVEKLTTK